MARYVFTAKRKAAQRKAAAASARKRKGKGKKPYAKRVGSRNRNGKFATKNQRRRNVAKKVATVAAATAYVGLAAASVNSTRKIEAKNRARIRSDAASKQARYSRIASNPGPVVKRVRRG